MQGFTSYTQSVTYEDEDEADDTETAHHSVYESTTRTHSLQESVAAPDDRTDEFLIEISSDQEDALIFECTHEHRNDVGTCLECGHWTLISQNDVQMKTKRRSIHPIIKDLEAFPFDDAVKAEANKIYINLNSIQGKKKTKKRTMFCAVYLAHCSLGRKCDPLVIGREFGLRRSEIGRTISHYNNALAQSNGVVSTYVEPIYLIDIYCDELRFTIDTVGKMRTEFIKLLAKSPSLKDKSPLKLVAAYIHYYMSTNGMKVDSDEYAAKFGMSFNTIKILEREISALDNSCTA